MNVSGLRATGLAELVAVGEKGERIGIAISLSKTSVVVTLLDPVSIPPKVSPRKTKRIDKVMVYKSNLTGRLSIPLGTLVEGTGRSLSARFSYQSCGRVLDVLGAPLDGKEPPNSAGTVPLESPALSVLERRPVTEPLCTGLLAFDALIPLGHGQREALMGDPKTGKTEAGLLLTQTQTFLDNAVKIIFVNVGQRKRRLLLPFLRCEKEIVYVIQHL